MHAENGGGARRQQTRRELLRQYMKLQRRLMDADPGSSAYQATVQAFRTMGYTLITSGFEDDLDRLLRIKVLEGGRNRRSPRETRAGTEQLLLLEHRTTG